MAIIISISAKRNENTKNIQQEQSRPLPASVNALLVNCAKAKNMKVTGIPF